MLQAIIAVVFICIVFVRNVASCVVQLYGRLVPPAPCFTSPHAVDETPKPLKGCLVVASGTSNSLKQETSYRLRQLTAYDVLYHQMVIVPGRR